MPNVSCRALPKWVRSFLAHQDGSLLLNKIGASTQISRKKFGLHFANICKKEEKERKEVTEIYNSHLVFDLSICLVYKFDIKPILGCLFSLLFMHNKYLYTRSFWRCTLRILYIPPLPLLLLFPLCATKCQTSVLLYLVYILIFFAIIIANLLKSMKWDAAKANIAYTWITITQDEERHTRDVHGLVSTSY